MKGSTRILSVANLPAAGIDRDAAVALIAAAGDIALVVDGSGVIRDVAGNEANEPENFESREWLGRPWVETVTQDSRGKVEAMLRDASSSGVSRRRQVNHPTAAGPDLPVSYTAVRLSGGTVVAVGRDMRPIASLQQRLVETQQALERDYWRLRHVETRYRLLFQVSTEAILIVDAATRRVVDANEAAARLFDKTPDKLNGRTFPIGIDGSSEAALEDALANARSVGRSGAIEVRLAGNGPTVEVSISCFRQDAVSLFLVRFGTSAMGKQRDGEMGGEVVELLSNAPDAFVITDVEGRVMSTNRAFLDVVQLSGERQAHGRLISDWIGRPGADLSVFLAMLRKHGVVRRMDTAVRGEQGGNTEVEVSVTAAHDAEEPCLGFILRDIGRRIAHGPQGARDLTRAVEELTSLVGRTSLRDLLRDTTDLVERHFIEAALELTDNNRTAASEVLGLSRQSLYVKLRRHGLAVGGDAEGRKAG